MHRFERLDRLKKGGVMPERQTTVPAEELAERQALGAKYHAQRRINQINMAGRAAKPGRGALGIWGAI